MASVFSKVMNGDLPGRVVYSDDRCAAFLTIAPIRLGHTLVVPREEIDSWLDLPPALAAHLTTVAQQVGQAVQRVVGCARVGLVIAGLEVPHCHLHVLPLDDLADLDFGRADGNPDQSAMDAVAAQLSAALTQSSSPLRDE